MNRPVVAGSMLRWLEQRPEPAGLWIRALPSHWPDAGSLWVDLSRGVLGSLYPAVSDIDGLAVSAANVDDLHWIPPVARELTESRDELVARVRGAGAPVLVHVAAGDALPVEADVLLVDPLAWLVRPGREVAIEVPADAWLLWPILAGLSEDLDAFDEVCRSLRRQGARGVLPIAMRISAVERRLLARGRDDLFEALFHSVVPAERRFAERAKTHGLEAWLERPLAGPPRVRRRRAAAGLLAEIGELGSRLSHPSHPMSRNEAFFRAARDLEAADVDLDALYREGNLAIWPWRDPEVSRVLTEFLSDGRSTTRDRMLDRYLRGDA